MKKVFFYALAALTVSTLATGCSDDDPKSSKTFDEVTRTEANGLSLTVGGAPMPGMSVQYTPGADASKGSIRVFNEFDLAAIPGVPEALRRTVAGPGAIPGTPELTIPLGLTVNSDETAASFEGDGTTTYATYKYSGNITDAAINLAFTDVALLDQSLAGRYTLAPYSIDDDWESDTYGTILSNPVYVNWVSGADFDFLGTPMTPAALCQLLFAMPLLNDMTVTVPEFFTTLLKDVDFGTDGNITANYLDLDSETPKYLTSPVNMAQYVVASDSRMLFFLNPQAVIADASRADAAVDMNNVLGNVMAQLAPMMSQGVPMNYTRSDDNTALKVYLGTETLLPLLKQNVVPLLRDENTVNQLVALVGQQEGMDFIAALLPSMIASAADMIDQTTVLEIGLNLQPAK